MTSLSEIYAARQQEELMDKLASVAEVLGDDPEIVEAFDVALELVKEAGIEDEGDQIDAAFELLVDELSDDEDEFDKEAEAEEAYELGLIAAEIAADAGVDLEDLEKIASDEEAEDLGRMLAHAVFEELEG